MDNKRLLNELSALMALENFDPFLKNKTSKSDIAIFRRVWGVRRPSATSEEGHAQLSDLKNSMEAPDSRK